MKKLFDKCKDFWKSLETGEQLALIVTLCILLAIIATPAKAGGIVINNNLGTPEIGCNGLSAAQIHPYQGYNELQAGIGLATCGSVSLGIAKKPCPKCPMYNGTISADGDDLEYGGGINFRF